MSQASVRLRELERDVEASRDVYQSFLKRSRETEEQETLNTSSARIIGEATVPQRRTFPPAMSLIAMIGFVLGGLAAAAWIVAVDQLMPGANPVQPRDRSGHRPSRRNAQPPRPRSSRRPRSPAATRGRPDREAADRTAAGIRRDAHARRYPGDGRHRRRHAAGLADAARRLSADDVPQRHARDARDAGQARASGHRARHGRDRRRRRPGPQHRRAEHRALGRARRRQGADDRCRSQGTRTVEQGQPSAARASPAVSAGSASAPRPSRAIKTANGISILPAAGRHATQRPSDAIRKAIAQARAAGGYDLVILDGPAMPWSPADRKLLDVADGLVAILPITSTSTTAWKTSSPRSAGPSASWSVSSSTNSTQRPSTVSETSNMRERRVNPVGRAATASVPRITLGGLRLAVLDLEQTANFMIDMVFPQRRVAASALPDLGQWRGAGALLDRTDDRPAVSRRRSDQCRRPAARDGVAVQIVDAAARARRDHRPVPCRRPQGAGGRTDLLHVRRRRSGERRRRRQRSQDCIRT